MPTVGEILRSEREQKGLSIKDIEKATSIRSLYLDAIENDNYDIIPGEVYVKGFIRNYANYLELDAKNIIDLYRQAKNPSVTENVKTDDTIEEKTDNKSVQPSDSRAGKAKWIIAGVVGVVVIGSLWWTMGSHNRQSQQAPDTRPAPTSPYAPAQPAPTPSVSEKPVVQANPVVVVAKYTDSCWTLVTADGKEVYEGIPKIGETLTWEAQKDLTVQLGNAGGVEMVYNGQSLGSMGGKGEVLKKTFSATKPKQ